MTNALWFRAVLTIAISLVAWMCSPAAAIALTLDVSVGEGGIVVFSGTGWSNENPVTLTAGNKKVAEVTPENDGTFKTSVKSKTVKVGTQVTADDGAGDTKKADAVEDPKKTAWSSVPGGAQFLTNFIFDTELLVAGFSSSGTVTLSDVSPNARLTPGPPAPETLFPLVTGVDSLRTTGVYDLLGIGPVFGTYVAIGTFSNLFDEDTGQIISGIQTITFTDQIGNVVFVPEPSSFALVALGFVVLGVISSRRVRAHTGRM